MAPIPKRIAVLAVALLVPLLAWRIYWLPEGNTGAHIRLLLASMAAGFSICGLLAWTLARALRQQAMPRSVLAALAVVAFAHLLFFVGMFPGLIISDALHVYFLGRSGSIDNGYGYFWPLALNAALALLRHPGTAGVLQALYFMALLAWMGGWLAGRRSPGVAAAVVLVAGLWPVMVLTVTYQHRDTAAALVALHWALHALVASRATLEARGRAAVQVIGVHAFLLLVFALLRPDVAPVAVALLLAVAFARRRRGHRHETHVALAASLAVLLAFVTYNAAVQAFVEVHKRATPYPLTLVVQPIGHILAKGSAAQIPPGTLEAFEKLFEPGKLAEMADPRNIGIIWSPHIRRPADPRAYSDFYRASLALIAANPMFALENRWLVYVRGNGFGGLQEVHQDQARTAAFAQHSGFGGQEARPRALATLAHRFIDAVQGAPDRAFPRAVLWNTLPLVALAAFALALFPIGHGAWLLGAAILARAGTLLLAAPATQYAYHFPVMLMGVALVAAFLARGHDG